jgi:hypothetical protein
MAERLSPRLHIAGTARQLSMRASEHAVAARIMTEGAYVGVSRLLQIEGISNDARVLLRSVVNQEYNVVLPANHDSHINTAVLLKDLARDLQAEGATLYALGSHRFFPSYYDDAIDRIPDLKPEERHALKDAFLFHKKEDIIPHYKVMRQLLGLFGMNMIPTLQPDYVSRNTRRSRNTFVHRFLLDEYTATLSGVLSGTKNVVVVFPEGTRHKDGMKRPAMPFFDDPLFSQHSKRIVLSPIGLSHSQEVLRNPPYNIFTTVQLESGTIAPFSDYEQEAKKRGITVTELVMSEVASHVYPEEMRGEYR